MQNRFGLKDFVVLVLLLGLGISMWLAMFQRDHEWDEIQKVRAKLDSVERQISRVEDKLDGAAPAVLRPPQHPGDNTAAPVPTPPPRGARDDSWARPGVPVAWQEPWGFATDPRGQPGFVAGGEFTEIFDAQPPKLVPFIQTDVYGRRGIDLVVQSLGDYDPKTLELRGRLAEAWQYDPNGLWLRVKMNLRARFSDGEPVTAEDVRWTFHDFVQNEEIEAQRTRSIIDPIERVDVLSEHVVEFTFKEAFFSNLSLALVELFVLPKHFYSRFEPAEINRGTGLLMGSGPYKLETLDPNNQWTPPAPILLVRNEQYWGTKPPLERIRFKTIRDEQARLVAYKNDEGDMITPSSPQYASLAKDADWNKTHRCLDWVNMRSGNSFIAWNCGLRNGKPTPFVDARVRRAMTMLLDREKMIRDVWAGYGVVGKGYFIPGAAGSDPNLKPWPYNLGRAKELLKEVGWDDRDGNGVLEDDQGSEFVFEFTYFSGGEIYEKIARFVKDASAAAGIRCNLRVMDWAVGDPMRKQRDFDGFTMAWSATAPESDPKQIFHSESIKDQGDNFSQWSNPEADRLIDAGRRELDDAKRFAIWRELEKVMHESGPYTWVRVAPWLRFVDADVENVSTYPKGLELWEFYRSGIAAPASGL